jgi:hypothetical protein
MRHRHPSGTTPSLRMGSPWVAVVEEHPGTPVSNEAGQLQSMGGPPLLTGNFRMMPTHAIAIQVGLWLE